jgi:hypothetical protein
VYGEHALHFTPTLLSLPVNALTRTLHSAGADLSESPLAILLVGVVPLAAVTYMQARGTIGMGMKVKAN